MKRVVNKDNLQEFIDLNNGKQPEQNKDWIIGLIVGFIIGNLIIYLVTGKLSYQNF